MNSNPLSQYFRQPAIYIRLPSNGKFYPAGSLEKTENGEYPIFPMTTLDEITYRTPDALFNGTAVVSVIQSCMPNIKNAWNMPSIDIDTVLVAIRIATYGHSLDISTRCPKCTTEADYGLDLRGVLDQIKAPDYDNRLELGDLEVYLHPMNYKQMTDNSLSQFEDQKILQMMQDSEVSEKDKLNQISEVLKKITTVTTRALSQNIAMVKTPNSQVTDSNHITEWLANCDRNRFNKIRDFIIDTKNRSELQPLHIKCGNCQHEYDQAYTLDMTNFFEAAS